MGMYTELHFNSELKKDVPPETLAILQYMVEGGDTAPPVPEHPLFSEGTRWRFMLQSDSYYFDADTHSTLRHDFQGGWYLCIRCNLKNYSDEIQNFIEWVRLFLDKHEGDFLGFYRYEESDEPTLIYA